MATPIWPIEGVALGSDVTPVTGSLGDYIIRMFDDNTSAISVYPTLAVGATVVSAAVNWTLGNLATVVPAGQIANPFLLQLLSVESMSKNGVFELVLYSGADDDEIARVRFSQLGGFFGYSVFNVPTILNTAEARIRAALACSTGGAGAATATVSVGYRELA